MLPYSFICTSQNKHVIWFFNINIVTLNDNVSLFQPNFDILFSKNIFKTLKVDTLLTFNVLSMDIKSFL